MDPELSETIESAGEYVAAFVRAAQSPQPQSVRLRQLAAFLGTFDRDEIWEIVNVRLRYHADPRVRVAVQQLLPSYISPFRFDPPDEPPAAPRHHWQP